MGKGNTGELMNLAKQQTSPPSPPPPPPRSMWSSYTRREIERFWRKKRLVEEEHLLAAIKAAARLRATHLSKDDYRRFLESLEEIEIMEEDIASNKRETKNYYGNNQEIRVGIKDWWTKSKYAYLNEPAVGTMKPSRRSNYKPNNMFMCNYKLSSPVTNSSSKAPYLGIF
ncbi:uncharacterized protein LOC141611279 [Silene latifolia]|uniref:uncharacterized protein LOC141611279 n=1 Tax=Silene latifolia TaxID=37657 RepID=UPI003D77A27D